MSKWSEQRKQGWTFNRYLGHQGAVKLTIGQISREDNPPVPGVTGSSQYMKVEIYVRHNLKPETAQALMDDLEPQIVSLYEAMGGVIE